MSRLPEAWVPPGPCPSPSSAHVGPGLQGQAGGGCWGWMAVGGVREGKTGGEQAGTCPPAAPARRPGAHINMPATVFTIYEGSVPCRAPGSGEGSDLPHVLESLSTDRWPPRPGPEKWVSLKTTPSPLSCEMELRDGHFRPGGLSGRRDRNSFEFGWAQT